MAAVMVSQQAQQAVPPEAIAPKPQAVPGPSQFLTFHLYFFIIPGKLVLMMIYNLINHFTILYSTLFFFFLYTGVDASLLGQPQPPLQQVPGVGQAGMNPPNQRSVVWQGALEWQEKKADNNSRVVHQVTCKMTALVVNGEPEV